MDASAKDYLTPALSHQERLTNACALLRGFQAGLDALLARVASYHGLLDLELGDSAAGRLYLQESTQAVQHAQALVDAVRGVVDDDEASESIDLERLLKGVVSRLRRGGYESMALTQRNEAHEQIFVFGDLILLQQLFMDLPALAAATGAGGSIHIDAGPRTFAADFFHGRKSALGAGTYYAVWISAAAPTAPEGKWSPLFERVTAAPAFATSARAAFACGVVRFHGGDIFVPRREEQLNGLLLLFPMRRNKAAMFDGGTANESNLRGNETILLVDDEGIIWDVVIDMLQDLGYTVILAADGQDCVDIYRDNPGKIDLVLLDMVMPRMNGHQAFHHLKDIDESAKILLSSGYVKAEEARDVLAAGALGFLQKPYRMTDLAREIRRIFDT